jgi:hypothetical protein
MKNCAAADKHVRLFRKQFQVFYKRKHPIPFVTSRLYKYFEVDEILNELVRRLRCYPENGGDVGGCNPRIAVKAHHQCLGFGETLAKLHYPFSFDVLAEFLDLSEC